MTAVHRHVVVVDDAGVTLATYGLALVIRSRAMPLTALPKNTHTIIMDGFGDHDGADQCCGIEVYRNSHCSAVSWNDGSLCPAPACQCEPCSFEST
jgi:hypothetical protein